MSTVHLKVVIWQGQLLGRFVPSTVTPKQRLEELEKAVGKARAWLNGTEHTGNGTTPVLKIFVAPEYLLEKSSESQNGKALSFDDLQMAPLEKKFEDWSEGILLIPGTVVRKKPVNLETLKGKQELYKTRIDDYYRRYEKRTGNLRPSDGAKNDFQYGVLDKIEALEKNRGNVPYLVRNSAYIYYNKVSLLKYKKQGEYSTDLSRGDQLAHDNAIAFVRGYKEGLFQVKPSEGSVVRCGVEICADHSGRELQYSKGGTKLHLHFLLSDYISIQPAHIAVKEGGYLVHASTDPGASGLYLREKSTPLGAPLTKATVLKTENLSFGKLACFAESLEL